MVSFDILSTIFIVGMVLFNLYLLFLPSNRIAEFIYGMLGKIFKPKKINMLNY